MAPAIITRVWSDDMLNVTVFPDAHERGAQPETSINLYETEDEARDTFDLLTNPERILAEPAEDDGPDYEDHDEEDDEL